MWIDTSLFRSLLFWTAVALLTTPLAFAHIRINPTQSTFGAREKYTMRVPNEKQSPTIRVEGEFPAGLEVYDFEFKPGWKIDFKKNDQGKIIGATWTGTIAPYEFVEFGMLAINPKTGDSKMLWKFHQFYKDGTTEDFVSAPDAQMPLLPMPLVTLKPADSPSAADSSAKPPLAASVLASGALIAQGKALFTSYTCNQCHGLKGEGADDGPNLIHAQMKADEIAKFLEKPSVDASLKGMPEVPASSPDLQPLVAYVLSLEQ
jgi:uncharacterized protein YcnI